MDLIEKERIFAETFADKTGRRDAANVVRNLTIGFNLLRTLFIDRAHRDVESAFGIDSVVIPVEPLRAMESTRLEVDLFQVAQATSFIRDEKILEPDDWFGPWLSELRLGERCKETELAKRIKGYVEATRQQRRLSFSRGVERALPEATRTPLVLYRLFPLAVDIATSLALGDTNRATGLRSRQMDVLLGIRDCSVCHGRLLEPGEHCKTCGNPVWTFAWLNAD